MREVISTGLSASASEVARVLFNLLARLRMSFRTSWYGFRASPIIVTASIMSFVLYWLLRVHYWHVVYEPPFSDTADYVDVAKNILSSFTFYSSPFWKSFWAPGLPASIASVFLVFGKDNQLAWQFSQTLLNCVAALWLSAELAIATKKRFLFLVFFTIIAISKSSIFWSVKYATESLIETQTFLLLALLLSIWRRPKVWKSLLLGFLFSYAFLTKATIFGSLPILTIMVLLSESASGKETWKLLLSTFRDNWRQSLVLVLALYLGMLVLWVPWMVRSYRLYHHVLPFTTHQPLAMLWEQWGYTIQLEGHAVTRSESDFFQRGPREFTNDYELYRFAYLFAGRWYLDQWHGFPVNISQRLVRVFTQDTDLTTVPRRRLFNTFTDILLIDKSFLIFLVATLATVIGSLRKDPVQMGMAAVFLVPIVAIISMSGLPRLFEPYIPLATVNAVIGYNEFTVFISGRQMLGAGEARSGATGLR